MDMIQYSGIDLKQPKGRIVLNGMSRLFRQLIREYVYMDICCLHKNFPSQSRK